MRVCLWKIVLLTISQAGKQNITWIQVYYVKFAILVDDFWAL